MAIAPSAIAFSIRPVKKPSDPKETQQAPPEATLTGSVNAFSYVDRWTIGPVVFWERTLMKPVLAESLRHTPNRHFEILKISNVSCSLRKAGCRDKRGISPMARGRRDDKMQGYLCRS